jgi:hypothetical protein
VDHTFEQVAAACAVVFGNGKNTTAPAHCLASLVVLHVSSVAEYSGNGTQEEVRSAVPRGNTNTCYEPKETSL